MCFNSIVINHKSTYDAVVKKDTFVPVVLVLKGPGGNAIALRRPCLPLSAIIVSLNHLPRSVA